MKRSFILLTLATSLAWTGISQGRVLANIPPQPVPATFAPDADLPQARVIEPTNVVLPSAQLQFQAQNLMGPVDWKVNGAKGGSVLAGTIDDAGLYTAPDAQPQNLPVIVSAETPLAAASASIDVLEGVTRFRDLGVVQSLSFLESLGKLYSAELVGFGGGSPASLQPSGVPGSEIYTVSQTRERY